MTSRTDTPSAGASRLIGLDLLRLLAVVLVLGHHMERPPEGWNSPLAPVLNAWMVSGGLGVDTFFVLSGFLVSGLLFAEYKKRGEMSIKRFYVRRAWKIYPPFYFLIVFTFLYSLLALGFKVRDRPLFAELFFIQSYSQGLWNHTWTLAVEEHFYLLLPLLLLTLAKRNPGAANPFRAIPYLVAASSVAFLAIRLVNFAVRDTYSFHTHVFATHLRLDALFFGVGIGYFWHFHGEAFRRKLVPWRYAMIGAGAALLTTWIYVPIPMNALYIHTFAFTQNYLGAALVVTGVILCAIPVNRVTAALASLGSYSYSIYLWHMALMYWAIPHMQSSVSWQWRTAIYMIGAFVIGIAAAKLVEMPMLALRDRWYPSRTSAAEPIQPAPQMVPAPQRQAA